MIGRKPKHKTQGVSSKSDIEVGAQDHIHSPRMTQHPLIQAYSITGMLMKLNWQSFSHRALQIHPNAIRSNPLII